MKQIRALLAVSALMAGLAASSALAEETPPSIAPGAGEAAVPREEGVTPPADTEVVAEMSREERIDSLFATLKSETDAESAKEIEATILRLWLESGSDTVDLLMSWTLKAMEEKQYPRALDFLDRIILLAPDYAEGWNKRATVYFLLDDYGNSIADIGRVLELEPRHFGALSGLGMIMRSLGDDERAIAAYKEALAVDPHLENVKQALDELEGETGGEGI